MIEMAVEVTGLRKTYLLGRMPVEAIRGLDLQVPSGEIVAITGPSGCGKSTLLNILGALDRPTEGKVVISGTDISEAGRRQLVEVRRNIGMVFQFFNLVPRLTARENVELGLNIRGVKRSKRRRRAEELLAYVGLEDRAAHRPTELSGGEQQRVAIARALANEPRFLLMDEPTGNLDSRTALDILELVERLHRDRGLTTIIATHDRTVAGHAHRTVHMVDGTVQREAGR